MKRETINTILSANEIFYNDDNEYACKLADSLEKLYALCQTHDQMDALDTILDLHDYEDAITLYKLYEHIKGDK